MLVLAQLTANLARLTPQPEDGITYAAKIEKIEALVDWSRDAGYIDRQIRAFNPWPVAETRLAGEQLRIYRAAPLADLSPQVTADPGTIVDVREDSLLVACGRGYLAVQEVQRPGRRPVGARDLAHTVELTGRRFG